MRCSNDVIYNMPLGKRGHLVTQICFVIYTCAILEITRVPINGDYLGAELSAVSINVLHVCASSLASAQ